MKKFKLYCAFALLIIVALILLPTESKAYTNYFKSSKYKITEGKDKILSNLNAKDLTAKTVLSNVSLTSETTTYGIKAYNGNTELTGSKQLGTGSTLKVVHLGYGYSIDNITLVVYGDTNGDAKITAADALAIVKNKTGKVKFKSEYCLEAGRITNATREKNTTPSAADALAIIKYRLGKASINQFRQIQVTVSSYEDLYTQLGQCNTNLKFDATANEIMTNYNKLKEVVNTYCNTSMSQTTKALVLHDYLVAGSKLNYETDYCDSADNESNICNVGKTMNQLGFANTYTSLLGIAGIPSKVIRDKYSNYGHNAINEVTIDGQPYFVSCGADSHISKVEGKGKIRRYYFLRNTEQLEDAFWEDEAYFSYTPVGASTSTSTKYYGVRWPQYRKALDYKNSEIKTVTGKTIVRNVTELKEALLKGKDYIVDVMDSDSEATYELDEFCKKVIAKYIKSDMNEAEKALTIYDYVCSNFMRADHEAYEKRTNISNADYDRAWGYYKTSLLSGMGDCISATSSFNTLCAYVGIETKMINEHQVTSSHGMGNHHWSVVKIDGQWYHCDCEGSDYYQYGEVDRTWFLYSDVAMNVTENTVQPCTSSKYDNYKWPEFKGVAYYQDKTGIISEKVPATSFWIRQKDSAIIGDNFSLMLRVFPYGSNDKATYSSSNTNVATVDKDGNVVVKAKGSTTIKVTVNGMSKSFILKTGNKPNSLELENATLKIGQTKKMNHTAQPEDALYYPYYWSSSNTEVATVDQNGVVTAVGVGTAKIRMQYAYSMNNTTYVGFCSGGEITVTK